jgi:hypothetical protein
MVLQKGKEFPIPPSLVYIAKKQFALFINCVGSTKE